ncbi:MAG TPA: acyltransferase family protein, partial [Acidimicrobiales bacterium]|nr:acyltransferase family protein [Acidimicrobiales bacterium]
MGPGPRAPEECAPAGAVRPRVGGLDGLRGLAVAAVLAFHGGVAWVRGGMIGVDAFFVLSGFLITSLLLAERRDTGRVDLVRFWGRRARRLLPALAVMLLGVAAYAHWLAGSDTLARLRGDALSTLVYGSNWHFVASGQDYFTRTGVPSPLLHTWSLGVEEQFYLLWPVVVAVAYRLGGRRAGGWTAAGLALASATVTAVLQTAGSDPSRLYYGTDTRAQALMVGAALACWPGPWSLGRRPEDDRAAPGGRRRLPGWPVVTAAGGFLIWAAHDLDGRGPLMYRGGLLLVAVAVAAVLAAAATPGSAAGRLLSFRPLRALGRISYGVYLYHWPLFLVLDHARTGLRGPALLALRLAATLAVAAASHRWIERPLLGRAPARPSQPAAGPPPTAVVGAGRGTSRRWPAPAVLGASASVVTVGCLLAATAAPVVAPLAEAAGPFPGALAGSTGAKGSADGGAAPVKVLVLGDSVAVTLRVGLEPGSLRYGVTLTSGPYDASGGAQLGCDFDPGTTVRLKGEVAPATTGCRAWRSTWSALVQRYDPDVVAVLMGRWELPDRRYGGHWTHVGLPDWDAHLTAELQDVIDLGSARGASVALLTFPLIGPAQEAPDGSTWAEDDPARVEAFNGLLRAAAAGRSGVASVVDLDRM